MAARDETALTCDMMEVYHVLDWRELPVAKAAALAAGLSADSRSVRAITGQKHSVDTMLLSVIADQLRLLWWAKTVDGQKNRNRPESLTRMLMGEKPEKQCRSFASGEEFEKARQRLIAQIEEAS